MSDTPTNNHPGSQTDVIPDPIIIGPEALKAAIREKHTGLMAAYDASSQAGGIIHLESTAPRWMIFVPISRGEFMREVDATVGQFLNMQPRVH
jgi:hypothetical protein